MSEVPPPLPVRPQSFSTPRSDRSHLPSALADTPPRLPPRKSYVDDQLAQAVHSSPGLQRNGNPDVIANEIFPQVNEEVRFTDSVDSHKRVGQVVQPENKNGNDPLSRRQVLPPTSMTANGQQPSNPFEASSPTQDPMALLNTLSTPHHLGSLPLPSPGNIILISFLVVLAYAGASFISLLIASAGVYYLWADWQRREALRLRDPEEDREKVKGKVPVQLAMAEESTEWL